MSSLVSIIIPCYNGERFLDHALKSVVWQTHQEWECILIDDGSTDASSSVFKSFAGSDARFRYHYQSNKGLAAARNAGIELARGDFIQFLDADDVILKEKLERSLVKFESDPSLDAVYTEYACLQHDGRYSRPLPSRLPMDDALRAYIVGWNRTFGTPIHTFLVRTATIGSLRFDERLISYAEDFDFWLRFAARRPRYCYLGEVLIVYRVTTSTLITQASRLMKATMNVLAKARTLPESAEYQRDIDESIAYYNERLVMAYFMERRFEEGRDLLKSVWSSSTLKGRMKMIGWYAGMRLFSLERIVRMRSWIFDHTPFRWGGWVNLSFWAPPESIRSLMSS